MVMRGCRWMLVVFRVIVDNWGWFWVVVDGCGLLWISVDGCDWLWVVAGGFGLLHTLG